MSVFCITFSVQCTQYKSHNLHRRWTRRFFMLAISSLMPVKSMDMRVFFSILSSAKLFYMLWLIDARRYVKINFSLLMTFHKTLSKQRQWVTSTAQFSNL